MTYAPKLEMRCCTELGLVGTTVLSPLFTYVIICIASPLLFISFDPLGHVDFLLRLMELVELKEVRNTLEGGSLDRRWDADIREIAIFIALSSGPRSSSG